MEAGVNLFVRESFNRTFMEFKLNMERDSKYKFEFLIVPLWN